MITAIHGTIVGRASADAKTSLAYASLTQVGVVFVEIGIGWEWIAVAHILGHAMVRTLQFLRAPSMLHDYHAMHSAAGGEIAPTGRHLEEMFPERHSTMAVPLGAGPRPSGHDTGSVGHSSANAAVEGLREAGSDRTATVCHAGLRR